VRIVKSQCFSQTVNARECSHLLQNLDYSDMLTVMMTKVSRVYRNYVLVGNIDQTIVNSLHGPPIC